MPVPTSRHRYAAVSIAVLAVSVLGCGSSPPSDAQQVTKTIRTYLRAQASGDGERACSQLTLGGQRQLIALVVRVSKGMLGRSLSCETAVGLVRGAAGTTLMAQLDHARVTAIRVTGARATADVLIGPKARREHVLLEKTDSTWMISEVPTLPGAS
jgi:hypothetical protein